jgi:hypothetical protein
VSHLERAALHWSFSLPSAYSLQIPPANWKQAQAAEEIYQTLLSNRKPGKIDYVHATNTIKPTQETEEIH